MPETAPRITVPDTADLLHLEVTGPSEAIDPEGKAINNPTFQWPTKPGTIGTPIARRKTEAP